MNDKVDPGLLSLRRRVLCRGESVGVVAAIKQRTCVKMQRRESSERFYRERKENLRFP
jgi:hypothetical protein